LIICSRAGRCARPASRNSVRGVQHLPTMFVGDVIAGHGVTPFLQAAQMAGCNTANGGHMVEATQDVMADFLLHDDDNKDPGLTATCPGSSGRTVVPATTSAARCQGRCC
jgi:hypothetical protein